MEGDILMVNYLAVDILMYVGSTGQVFLYAKTDSVIVVTLVTAARRGSIVVLVMFTVLTSEQHLLPKSFTCDILFSVTYLCMYICTLFQRAFVSRICTLIE
jgi:hypothetical protein